MPGFDNSANVDLIAIYLTGAATLLLLAVPFIPGLRDIPEIVPIHRVVWRNWHERQRSSSPGGGHSPTVGSAGAQEVDDEHQRLAALDGSAGATAAITQVWRDGEPASPPVCIPVTPCPSPG